MAEKTITFWAAITDDPSKGKRETEKGLFLSVAIEDGSIVNTWWAKSAIVNQINTNLSDWQQFVVKDWTAKNLRGKKPAASKPAGQPTAPTAQVTPSQPSYQNSASGSSQSKPKKDETPGKVFQAFEDLDTMQIQAINEGQIIGEFFYQMKFKDKKTGTTRTRTGISANGAQAMMWNQKASEDPICFGPAEFDDASDKIMNPPGRPQRFACVRVSAWFTKNPEAKVWGSSAEPIDEEDPRYRFVAITAASKARRNAVFYLTDPVQKLKAIKAYEQMLQAIKTPALGAPKQVVQDAEAMEQRHGVTVIDTELSEEELNAGAEAYEQMLKEEQGASEQPTKHVETVQIPPKPMQPKPPKGAPPGVTIIPEVMTLKKEDPWGEIVQGYKATIFHKEPANMELAEKMLAQNGRAYLDAIRKAFPVNIVGENEIQEIFISATVHKDPLYLQKMINFLQQAFQKGGQPSAELWKAARTYAVKGG